MEVILLERVAKLGQMGEVVRVKDGFARNFLLKRGKALRATADNRAKFDGMKAELEARNLQAKGEAAKRRRKDQRPKRRRPPSGLRNWPVVRIGERSRHHRIVRERRRQHQPKPGHARRADQVDRQACDRDRGASGSRSRRDRHRCAQRGRSRTHQPRRRYLDPSGGSRCGRGSHRRGRRILRSRGAPGRSSCSRKPLPPKSKPRLSSRIDAKQKPGRSGRAF